jgi:hypothetical protein
MFKPREEAGQAMVFGIYCVVNQENDILSLT